MEDHIALTHIYIYIFKVHNLFKKQIHFQLLNLTCNGLNLESKSSIKNDQTLNDIKKKDTEFINPIEKSSLNEVLFDFSGNPFENLQVVEYNRSSNMCLMFNGCAFVRCFGKI